MVIEPNHEMRRRTYWAHVAVAAMTLAGLCIPSDDSAGACELPCLRKLACRHPIWERTRWKRLRLLRCHVGVASSRCAGRLHALGLTNQSQEGSVGEAVSSTPVTGTVTVDGVPLTGGTVEFRSRPEAQRKIQAKIHEGQFSIPAEALPPGEYRIEIEIRSSDNPPEADVRDGRP
jgi:hypothetical protein